MRLYSLWNVAYFKSLLVFFMKKKSKIYKLLMLFRVYFDFPVEMTIKMHPNLDYELSKSIRL